MPTRATSSRPSTSARWRRSAPGFKTWSSTRYPTSRIRASPEYKAHPVTVLFDGIASGMLLFLISVGLSVTLGLMRFINLAHGAFAMLGGYICVTLLNHVGIPFLATLPLVMVCVALVGIVLERALYRRLYASTHLDQVLFSIGLMLMAIAAAHYVFGDQQQPLVLPRFLQGQINLPGLDLGIYRLFLVAVGLAIAVGLEAMVWRNHFSAQLRAAGDKPRAGQGICINGDRELIL